METMRHYKKLYVDSMIFIYLLEGKEPFFQQAKKHLESASHLIFSTFGLGEVLTGFEKTEDLEAKLKFLSFIETSKNLSVIGFGKEEALIFATLRAKYPSIKPPDAIHLATALSARADAFLSNDQALQQVKEIQMLTLT